MVAAQQVTHTLTLMLARVMNLQGLLMMSALQSKAFVKATTLSPHSQLLGTVDMTVPHEGVSLMR